jgi:hypothetical protein
LMRFGIVPKRELNSLLYMSEHDHKSTKSEMVSGLARFPSLGFRNDWSIFKPRSGTA